MNVLLYAPAFLYILITILTPFLFFFQICLAISVQLIVAAPFLLSFPREYIKNAFNLSRAFLYQWTVNWRFVSVNFFQSAMFSGILLIAWILGTSLFLIAWAYKFHHGVLSMLRNWSRNFPAFHPGNDTKESYVTLVFLLHLWGIITARSLHYQFYSWYFFTLPFLIQKMPFAWILGPLLLLSIEYGWNVYPSTNFSSLLLFVSHITLFFGVTFNAFAGPRSSFHCLESTPEKDLIIQYKSKKHV